MAPEPSMLELLRSRLADLEARQRARGGASEPGFWEKFSGRMPSASSEPPQPPERAGRRARRVAPETRAMSGPQGPWAGVPVEMLEADDFDLLNPPWLDAAGYEEMIDDPAWIEATSARAAERAARDTGEGGAGGEGEDDGGHGGWVGSQEAIAIEATLGVGLTSHPESELTRAAERVAQQRRAHEVTLVTIISELVSRGVEAPDGLSRSDWLRMHDPSLTAGQAKAFVTVGTAIAEARWARLRMLIATQQLTVGNAAQIVDFDARTAPVADPDDLTTAVADLTDQARQLRPEELARLVRHHTEQVRPPRDEDRLDRGRRDARGLWFGQPNATGMVGLRGVLDPEAAAVLKSAIDPLSAPRPEKDEKGRTIAPDERTAARRRLEALLEVVQRGVASAPGVPKTDKAKVVVLIDLDTLLADLNGDIPEAFRRKRTGGSGSGGPSGTCTDRRTLTGTGVTLSGDVLSPGVVRRMACDAEIIPMVLGGHSEPLDVGRGERLYTRAQRLALIARDRECTWPGCTVPATWCDVHHTVHWCRGGHTSIDTGALLCRKHHTHVHEHDLEATVTALGVTWHTR